MAGPAQVEGVRSALGQGGAPIRFVKSFAGYSKNLCTYS